MQSEGCWCLALKSRVSVDHGMKREVVREIGGSRHYRRGAQLDPEEVQTRCRRRFCNFPVISFVDWCSAIS